MLIAIAQCNYTIGDFEGNFNLIKSAIEKAENDGADLVVFSELAVCGYPPHDLLEYRWFVEKCEQYMQKIAACCFKTAAIVGGVGFNTSGIGKKLFNSAFLCSDGKIQQTINKTLLPTYDVFDEYRYFEPNDTFHIVPFKGKKIALTICEDLWYDQPVFTDFGQNKLYKHSPMKKLAGYSPDFIINIAASPFSYKHEEIKTQILASNAIKYQTPVIYVNQVGAQTEIIFDGGSLIMDKNGNKVVSLGFFKEGYMLADLDNLPHQAIVQKYEGYIPKIYDAVVLGIKDYFKKMGFTKATLGLSGGIDSAVTLAIAADALGSSNMKVLLMPSKYSSEHSITDSIKLAGNLGVAYEIISIQEVADTFDKALHPLFQGMPQDITEENIQARIRGTLLMALSNKFGHILLNTSNKSEASVGYGTLYGDMNGGLSVLGDVFKTDVYKLAHNINRNGEIIPDNIITKPPSAELRPDQKDSDSLPEYETLDAILYNYIELQEPLEDIVQMGFDRDVVTWVISKVNMNEHKRFQTPPILRVSSKAFGYGRRMPLVAKYLC